MNKTKFLKTLKDKLSKLPQNDINESISFYSEMIDDRIEDGLLEEEAVEDIGSIDDIAAQIIAERAPAKTVKTREKLTASEILAIILGSPIWISLLLTAIVVVASIIISVYTVLWSIVVLLWVVFISLVGGALGGGVIGILTVAQGNLQPGLFLIFAGFICEGLAILLCLALNKVTLSAVFLTKKISLLIKKIFTLKKKKAEEQQ